MTILSRSRTGDGHTVLPLYTATLMRGAERESGPALSFYFGIFRRLSCGLADLHHTISIISRLIK